MNPQNVARQGRRIIKPRRPSRLRKALTYTLYSLIFLTLCLPVVIFFGYRAWIVNTPLPNVAELMLTQKPEVVSRVYGIDLVDGKEIDVEVGRIFSQLMTSIPDGANVRAIEEAVVAAEDGNFYRHDGIDLIATLKAAAFFFKTGRMRGASTITMQLVKLYTDNRQRTIRRKFVEWYLAYHLEEELTHKFGRVKAKQLILRSYLNHLYVGHGRYGVEEAARYYFDTSADKLTGVRAAFVAALAKGAEKYVVLSGPPRERQASREALRNRVSYVLRRLVETGKLTPAQFETLRREEVVFSPVRYEPNVCGEYVTLAKKELRMMYGKERGTIPLEMRTTCVIPLQREVRRLFQEHLSTLDRVNGSGTRPQGTAMVVENETGRIIALIGGDDFRTGGIVRAFDAPQPPGSAAKILLFLAALKKGYLPTDVFRDDLVVIPPLKKGGKPWQPKNAHHVSHEWQTLRQAFAKSLNTVAAQLIWDMGKTGGDPFAGIKAMQDMASTLNFSGTVIDELSAALGVFDVPLVDLVRAVSTISHHGEYVEPHFFTHVREATSKIASWGTKEVLREQALAPELAHLMWTLLRSVVTDGTGVRAKNFPIPVGGKTGTAQNNQFTNFTGASLRYTVGISVSTTDPSGLGIDSRSGKEIQGAHHVPLFVSIMKVLYPQLVSEERLIPPGLLSFKTILDESGVPDSLPRPRCTAEGDNPTLPVTESLYLPTAIPLGCASEATPLARPHPRDAVPNMALTAQEEQPIVLSDPPESGAPPQAPAASPTLQTIEETTKKEAEKITPPDDPQLVGKDEGSPEDEP